MKRLARGSTLTLALLLLAFGVSPASAAPDACKVMAQAMLTPCREGSLADLWLARGKCHNLGNSAMQRSCSAEAVQEKNDAFGECADQLDARMEACRQLGGGTYEPVIDPNDFVATIDNPLLPMTPGTTYVYETLTSDGLEHDVVEVTQNTRTILGVTCVEVHDSVSVDGVLEEDTLDWFAQDKLGNVWYFGENSLSLEDGLIVGVGGSWQAGVDGAQPGIVMKAIPVVRSIYRQEFKLGTAEDMGEVLALNQTETVPFGTFTNLLETRDFSPKEPDADEHKFYAPGVGVVLEIDLETGDRTELISVTP